jgi:sigma-E factor negative regulatory protein RseC
MATEEGIVFKMGTPGAGTAWVKTMRSSACESCSSRNACHGEGDTKEMEVEAINTAEASVGDRIVLSIETASLLKATFLLYVFPILTMIAGALIGQALAVKQGLDPSGLSALIGCLFFGLAFVIIRIMGRHLARNDSYKPEIIKIRQHQPLSADPSPVLPQTE